MARGAVAAHGLVLTQRGYTRMGQVPQAASEANAWAQALRALPQKALGQSMVKDVGSTSMKRVFTKRGFMEIAEDCGVWYGPNFLHKQMKPLHDFSIGDKVMISYQAYIGSPFLSVGITPAFPSIASVFGAYPVTLVQPTLDNDLMWFFGYLINNAMFIDNSTGTFEIRLAVPAGAIETRVQAQLNKFNAGALTRIDATYVKLADVNFKTYWDASRWLDVTAPVGGGAIPSYVLGRTITERLYFLAGVYDYSDVTQGGDTSIFCKTSDRYLAQDLCALATSVSVVPELSLSGDIYTIKNDATYVYNNYQALNAKSSVVRAAPGVGAAAPGYEEVPTIDISALNPYRGIRIEFDNQVPFVVNGFCVSPNWNLPTE